MPNLACLHLPAKLYLIQCFPSLLRSEKPTILPFFQLCHFVVASPIIAETKLNAGARLQTFPSNDTKVVSEFQSIHGKVAFQTLLFENVTEKQKTKQTSNFFAPGGVRYLSLTILSW